MSGECVALRLAHRATRFAQLARLSQCQREACQNLSRDALADLIRTCSTIPGYRDALTCAPSPRAPYSEWRTFLSLLPILTKASLKDEPAQYCLSGPRPSPTYRNASGGSTGTPVELWQTGTQREAGGALKLFFDASIGVLPHHKRMVLWGSPRDLKRKPSPLRRFLQKRQTFDAFDLGDEDFRAAAACLREWRPRLVFGYAEAVDLLARWLLEHAQSPPPPHAVMTSAGTLTEDMRTRIHTALGAPVYNRYGSREVGDVACEMPGRTGLWICPLTHIVEIVDSNGMPVPPGVEGEILVTLLTNHYMPLIRYAIGDMGVMGPDPDDTMRPAWPRLMSVTGRTTDYFIGANNRRIWVPNALFERIPDVQQFQIEQTHLDRVTIRLVLTQGLSLSEHDRRTLVDSLCSLLGKPATCSIEIMERIPPAPSGKRRYRICSVPP